jgi:hypothetical protein
MSSQTVGMSESYFSAHTIFLPNGFFNSSKLPGLRAPSIGLFGVARVLRFGDELEFNGIYDFGDSPLLHYRSTVTQQRLRLNFQLENTIEENKVIFIGINDRQWKP